MRFYILLLLLLSLYSCEESNSSPPVIKVDVSQDIVNPNHYIIGKTNSPIHIDGKADEPIWQQTNYSTPFVDIEGHKTPKYETQIKMLWDDRFLYIFAHLEEPHIWGNLRQRDTVIFYNNDFEVFIDPSGDTYNYGEIEINVLGTVWDLLLDKPYRVQGKANNHWNLDDLKTAIYFEGSLNDPSDRDSFWNVEMAIPMKPLIEIKDAPKKLPKDGEIWRINFSRVNWDHDIVNGQYRRKKINGKYAPEYNWVWSNQNVINMHEPEKWGYLQFSEQSSTNDIKQIRDSLEVAKQIAFALFRKSQFGELRHLRQHKAKDKTNLLVSYNNKPAIQATYFKTNFGFEIKMTAPENLHTTITINETGKIKTSQKANYH